MALRTQYYEQLDLFLDLLSVDASIRDTQATMSDPYFALEKNTKNRKKPFLYEYKGVKIVIQPGPHGMATIYDKDVLMYLASILNEKIEQGIPTDRKIRFQAHDFLKVTHRGTGKRAYGLFLDALRRLQTTSIETSVATGDVVDRRGFSWISAWRVIEDETVRWGRSMVGVEVTIADWMYRAVVEDRSVLSIDRDYFRITSGIERRLYELARKQVGNQDDWWISLPNLQTKSGSMARPEKFKYNLRKIEESQTLLDYNVFIHEPPVKDAPFAVKSSTWMVQFKPKHKQVLLPPKPERSREEDLETDRIQSGHMAGETPAPVTMACMEQLREDYPDKSLEYLEQLERDWMEATKQRNVALRNPEVAFKAYVARVLGSSQAKTSF